MIYLYWFVDEVVDGSLIFVNFVEFDSFYGYCCDILGYVCVLEWFDGEIVKLFFKLCEGDFLILIVDYGNDFSWSGIDYICECVFVLCYGVG